MTDADGGSSGDWLPDPFADALLAARLCAIDPGLGGMVLRGGGEWRDEIVAEIRRGLLADAPVKRIPVHVDDDRLLGGLDLTATLARGVAVSQRGLLVEADGGVIVLPMAERMSDASAGRIAAVIDGGETRFLMVVFDDGIEAEELPPAAILERVAFRIDLSNFSLERGGGPRRDSGGVEGSTLRIEGPLHHASHGPPPRSGEALLTAIVATAAALGIDSARAPLFALRAARALALLDGRTEFNENDVMLAARLVLAARATRIPQMAPEESPEDAAPPPPPPENDTGEEESSEPGPIDDLVLAAALASLPKDVLARIAAGRGRRAPSSRARGAGERRKSTTRGRPMSARAGTPGGGLRLSLIDTLRAAAPWQKLRTGGEDRIRIRRDDLRIRRFETRAEAVTIFAVDASGSSALARLAEAKGAVELLLAEAYVKRAQVALIAFRGVAAELLLPPTRSLTRARRALAELPGGGGTPLAAGLNAARELAEGARAKGRTPFLVVLTDGRANIAADGSAVREVAQADADAAAKAIGMSGIAGAFVDTSARPRPEGAALAAAMGARYLPLPRADAATMHAAVNAARPG